jgi:hypothetical protein
MFANPLAVPKIVAKIDNNVIPFFPRYNLERYRYLRLFTE